MKKFFINLSMSLLFILIASAVVIVGVTLLGNFEIINEGTSDLIMILGGFLMIFVFGLLMGFKQKQKGFFLGILLMSVYLVVSFVVHALLGNIDSLVTLLVFSKGLVLFSGTLLGVFLINR